MIPSFVPFRMILIPHNDWQKPMITEENNIAQKVTESKDRPNDPRNQEFVHAPGDPQIGDLATPVNSSGIVRAYLSNLPAYRKGLTPMRRGLEVGMAHGYWIIGPFAKLGPLRDTEVANLAGLLSTVGLIVISTIAISLYASSMPPEPSPETVPPQPSQVFSNPNTPLGLGTMEGWNEYASGFLIGGVGGAAIAYFLIANINLLGQVFLNR